MLMTILLILLILTLIGGLPLWGLTGRYAYGPSVGTLIAIILVILLLGGR